MGDLDRRIKKLERAEQGGRKVTLRIAYADTILDGNTRREVEVACDHYRVTPWIDFPGVSDHIRFAVPADDPFFGDQTEE